VLNKYRILKNKEGSASRALLNGYMVLFNIDSNLPGFFIFRFRNFNFEIGNEGTGASLPKTRQG